MNDKINRTIFYYELDFKFLKPAEKAGRSYIEVINLIKKMCDDNSHDRFIKLQPHHLNQFGIFEYHTFENKNDFTAFKLIRIRKDKFPQLLDDDDTTLEDLEDMENKSVVESTHIIVDHSHKTKLRFAIEYNYEGPKTKEFLIFIKRFARKLGLTRNIFLNIISNDKLEEVANKIGKCKSMTVKVLKENITSVKAHDTKMGTMMTKIADFSQSKYCTVNLSFDYKNHNQQNKRQILGFIKKFTDNRQNLDIYDKFSIVAEDTTTDDKKFEVFDLLIDKVRSYVDVERKQSAKVVVSAKMYSLMLKEYNNKIA